MYTEVLTEVFPDTDEENKLISYVGRVGICLETPKPSYS